MSTKDTQPESQISPSSLQNKLNKPQRENQRTFSWIFYFLGGVILLGGLLVVVWQFLPSTNSGKPGSGNAATPNKNRPIDFPPSTQGDRPIYWQTIQQEMAQHLHLSVEALHTKLSTPQAAGDTNQASATPTVPADTNGKSATPPAKSAGSSGTSAPGISDVALEQGISTEQLQIIEINAIQHAFDKLVSQGIVTQQYADQWISQIRNWTSDTFNKYMTLAFIKHV